MKFLKIAIVVGTRPEIIKMSPVIRQLKKHSDVELVLIHSNQHYSHNLDAIFFQELGLPAPHYNLNVGSGSHDYQISKIMQKMEPILNSEKPHVVLVQGDTNTVLAAAKAAHQAGSKIGHVEAGLRSYDLTMPEERNRIETDLISDYLFAVTDVQKNVLLKEGILPLKVHVVGNTVVDAVLENKEIAQSKLAKLTELGLSPKGYCLFTAHRGANVDTKEALSEIFKILAATPMKVCWPIHHRTQKSIQDHQLKLPQNVLLTEPLGYFDFLCLMQNASLIVTDSGGLQEEACILHVPCITIRENTERPETIEVGANVLVGRDLKKFKAALERKSPIDWKNPFGDGTSAKQIVDILKLSLRA